MTTLRTEFFVEPFVEGQPGAHVAAAVSAVEAAGITVEVGPFASVAEGDPAVVADGVRAMLVAAFAAGATRVQLEVTRAQ